MLQNHRLSDDTRLCRPKYACAPFGNTKSTPIQKRVTSKADAVDSHMAPGAERDLRRRVKQTGLGPAYESRVFGAIEARSP